MIPDKLHGGSKLTLDYMNGLRELGLAGRLKVDPRTGLKLVTTPFGSFLRNIGPPDGWFAVTAALGSGAYTLVEQIEAPSGAWYTGPRTVSAYEVNLSTTVPTSSTIVYATKRRGAWRFRYGACS